MILAFRFHSFLTCIHEKKVLFSSMPVFILIIRASVFNDSVLVRCNFSEAAAQSGVFNVLQLLHKPKPKAFARQQEQLEEASGNTRHMFNHSQLWDQRGWFNQEQSSGFCSRFSTFRVNFVHSSLE